MSLLLAVDTSTAFLTLALCARDSASPGTPVRLLGETSLDAGRRHAELLFSATQSLLEQCGVTQSDLNLLAVTTGPGSFTGLRIGVAAWKGLAYGLNLPLIGVPTLDALSRLHPWWNDTVSVMLDAKMGEVFCATYTYTDGQRTLLRPAAALPPEAALAGLPPGTVYCGDGALRYAAEIRAHDPLARILEYSHTVPRASALAIEAFYLYDGGEAGDGARVEPIYLRKTQAEVNRDLREAAEAGT